MPAKASIIRNWKKRCGYRGCRGVRGGRSGRELLQGFEADGVCFTKAHDFPVVDNSLRMRHSGGVVQIVFFKKDCKRYLSTSKVPSMTHFCDSSYSDLESARSPMIEFKSAREDGFPNAVSPVMMVSPWGSQF
ncbi:MAG: hypothetical protein R2788_04495 [Saprospiraceae bacterium]